MLISPFNPLCFDKSKSDGIASRYEQVFAASDRIMLQFICPAAEAAPVVTLRRLNDDSVVVVTLTSWPMTDSVVYVAEMCGLDDGLYRVEAGGSASNTFQVTRDEEMLAGTALVQYSMHDNRRRTDGLFLFYGLRRFFSLRLPGGFKDSGVTFGVDSEQFTTALGDPIDLYSLDTLQRKFTLGGAEGVPVWLAAKLNLALTCHYVYFDGVRYARNDTATPEMSVLIEGVDSFVFSQAVRPVRYLDPTIEDCNLLELRRAGLTANDYMAVDIDGTSYNRLT